MGLDLRHGWLEYRTVTVDMFEDARTSLGILQAVCIDLDL